MLPISDPLMQPCTCNFTVLGQAVQGIYHSLISSTITVSCLSSLAQGPHGVYKPIQSHLIYHGNLSERLPHMRTGMACPCSAC